MSESASGSQFVCILLGTPRGQRSWFMPGQDIDDIALEIVPYPLIFLNLMHLQRYLDWTHDHSLSLNAIDVAIKSARVFFSLA